MHTCTRETFVSLLSALCSDLCPSECLPQTDVQCGPLFEIAVRRHLSSIELYSEVDANRSHRRAVPQAEPHGTARLRHAEFLDVQGHVASVDERHRTQSAANRNSHLGVQDDEALPAAREAVAIERSQSIEGEPADRRISARVKSLAQRDCVVDGLAVLHTRERCAQADPCSENEDRASRTPQLPVYESLHERLEKAHIRPQRPGRQFGIGADEASRRRLERIAPRVTNQRRRNARQALVGEQAIDLRLSFKVRLGEESILFDPVAPADGDLAADPSRQRRAAASAAEVEARPDPLLGAGADAEIKISSPYAPLEIRELHEVFVEPFLTFFQLLRCGCSTRQGRGALGPKAGAREQVERSVLAEQVPPADLKKSAGRDLKLFDGICGT